MKACADYTNIGANLQKSGFGQVLLPNWKFGNIWKPLHMHSWHTHIVVWKHLREIDKNTFQQLRRQLSNWFTWDSCQLSADGWQSGLIICLQCAKMINVHLWVISLFYNYWKMLGPSRAFFTFHSAEPTSALVNFGRVMSAPLAI